MYASYDVMSINSTVEVASARTISVNTVDMHVAL